MTVVDDQGRLFGVVNVIDAAVAVVILVGLAVGAAVVVGPFGLPIDDTTSDDESDANQQTVQYATVYVGPRVPEVVGRLAADAQREATTAIHPTDIYAPPDKGATYVRVRLVGRTVRQGGQERFLYNGSRVERGRQVTIRREDYRVSGRIVSVDETGDRLDTSQRVAVFRTRVPATTAGALERGDEYVVNGRPITRIESVRVLPGDGPDSRTVVATVSLQVLDIEGAELGGRPLRVGAELSLQGEDYIVPGRLTTVGTTETPVQETSVVVRDTVPAAVADAVSVGDQYTVVGRPVASVSSVAEYPAERSNRSRLLVGLSVSALDADGRLEFANRSVVTGKRLVFLTDEYRLEGRVVRTESDRLSRTTVTRSATVEVDAVRPSIAELLAPGDLERIRNTTTARVRSVSVDPTTKLFAVNGTARAIEDPTRRDVSLRVDLRGHVVGDQFWFHGRPVTPGDEVVLSLGSARLTGTVVALDGETGD